MRIERIFLFLVVIWSGFISISSAFDMYFFFPMIEKSDIQDDVIIQRLTVVRSASLTTIAYFSLRYFSNRKPLSSISPVLIWSLCLTFFGILVNIAAKESIVGWPVIIFFFGLNFVLFRLHANDSRKLFEKDW